MKLNVVNDGSQKTGSEIEVSDTVFGCAFNEPLVHQVVVAYQANGRQGTRAQKNRAAVRGGGRKPWQQKGTGRARAGTIRSPLWRGGGRIFPSSPQENFTHKVNKKMHRGAMRSILSELLRQDRLVAVADFNMAQPKTKALLSKLKEFGVTDVLIVSDKPDRALSLAARNLKGVDIRTPNDADPVSLIKHEKVIMTRGALKRFEELLQ